MQFPAGLVRKNGDAEGIKTGDDRGTRGVCFQSVHDKASLQYVIRLLSIQQSPLFSLSLIRLIGLHTHTHTHSAAAGMMRLQKGYVMFRQTIIIFIIIPKQMVFSFLVGLAKCLVI